ncbi:type VII secretion target [Actinophytocola sp. KF-1]
MNDGIQVVPEELETFASGMHQRGEEIAGLASTVKGIDLGVTSLGLLAQAFASNAIESTVETGEGIRLLGLHMSSDATYTNDAAASYRNEDHTHADRFGSPDVH